MNISVFGLGYVGTVCAACLARDGHTVVGVDVNQGKVDAINAGVAPIEVEIMREIQALERRLAELEPQGDEAVALRRKISDLRLDVSLRLEALAKRS